LVQNDAEGLAGILSPQRLPFRHPGDWQYKSSQPRLFLQPGNAVAVAASAKPRALIAGARMAPLKAGNSST